MRVLLDTCVLSELRKPQVEVRVRRAVAELSEENLYLSAITVGEIARGIELLDEGKRKLDLLGWLQRIQQDFNERVLSVDGTVAQIWGQMTAAAQKKGRVIPIADGLIAATALSNGLHLMTRNVADFEPTGVLTINPWTGS